jgi:transposase
MTLYIGIDVAKAFHIACFINSQGQMVAQLRFDNDAAGFHELQQTILRLSLPEMVPVFCGMESTGHYGIALRDFLTQLRYPVQVFNPLKVNRFRDFYIQPHKDDYRDAFVIAQMLRYGERTSYTPLKPAMRTLKQLTRYRTSLVRARAKVKTQIRAILDEIFPEYQQTPLFANVFGASSLALLKHFPTPQELAVTSQEELARLLSTSSRGHLGSQRAALIVEKARGSVGSPASAQAFAPILPDLIDELEILENRVSHFTAKIEAALADTDQTLTTIPGIGPVFAATILGEIGDIARFPSADALVAYCGLAPRRYQSGQFTAQSMRLAKRGVPQLRYTFYRAALVSIQYNPDLTAYYQAKVRRGKPKKKAVIAVARKLIRIVYALLKSQMPYVSPG